MILHQFKTFIEDKGVWVSTVAHDTMIGLNRTSETMVFKGNSEEIESFEDMYMESHGFNQDEDTLKISHKRIVEDIKKGVIEL